MVFFVTFCKNGFLLASFLWFCMHSSPLDTNALDSPSRLYRRELQGRFLGLRFTPVLEQEFKRFLRATQAPNLVFCVCMGLLLWLTAMAWDVVRYVQTIQGTPMQTLYWQTVPPARLLTLLALCVLLARGVHRLRGQGEGRQGERGLYTTALVTVVLYCSGVFVSGYIYDVAGASDAMLASILVLIAVLFPCGLTLREVLPVGALLLSAYWLAAWMILLPQQWSEFYRVSGLLMLCMGMMGLGSYLRERGTREQFLLRRLLTWEATHDPLTGLANHHSFQRHFETCMAQARREGKAVLLTRLNIDHFQQYHDHYGDKAGEQALQQVTLLLEQYAARPLDLAMRLGVEEFGLLSYGDDALSLHQRMQHLRKQVRELNILHEHSPTDSCLTVSMGIAQAEPRATADSLFQQAGVQLRHAQKEGRNRLFGVDRWQTGAAGEAQRAAS